MAAKDFIIQRHIEQAGGPIGAERTADLHRAHRPARICAAAKILDQFAQGQAEGALDQPAMLDVAGKLKRHRAARTAHAEIAVEAAALGQDDRHGGERNDIVDDGRLAEQALDGGQRRLEADLAALAFQTFEQRGFLAADIGAGAEPRFQIEIALAAENAAAEQVLFARDRDRAVELREGVRIFGADIDEALVAPIATPAIAMPSISANGSPSMIMRSEKVPLSPSSALQTMYFCGASVCSTVLHLMPVGNPAPPRPRNPESIISCTMAAGAMSSARRRPFSPPCAS